MDQVSGCNFMDIVSAGQILAISTEGDGMQRGIKSGPVPAGDRDHRVPGGDVPDSYFPTTGSSRVFSARAENKRTQRGAWEAWRPAALISRGVASIAVEITIKASSM